MYLSSRTSFPTRSNEQQNNGRRSDVNSGTPSTLYPSCCVFDSGLGFSGLRPVQFRRSELLISLWCFLGYVIYNVYLHPLSIFPGPKPWAATYIPYALSLRKGNLVYRIEEIHRKHGDIVRLGPNQLSFIQGEAWTDIYGKKPAGWADFQKDPTSYRPYALSHHVTILFLLAISILEDLGLGDFGGEGNSIRDSKWHMIHKTFG